jgi:hypothetical protein
MSSDHYQLPTTLHSVTSETTQILVIVKASSYRAQYLLYYNPSLNSEQISVSLNGPTFIVTVGDIRKTLKLSLNKFFNIRHRKESLRQMYF